ncbi:MAG TPA: hypothetical protein VN641_11220 [Urbifossiella sp.]|nr:hypothetical protein [Urbifossiella sp.]
MGSKECWGNRTRKPWSAHFGFYAVHFSRSKVRIKSLPGRFIPPELPAMHREPEDEDEDRPRRKQRYNDDDEDRRRPRKGLKKKSKRGPPWGLYAGIGGGVIVVIAMVVLVLVLGRGRKDDKNDKPDDVAGGPGASSGGPASAPASLPAGEMAGMIGEVDGLLPAVLKPMPEAAGLAFRIAIHGGWNVNQLNLAVQPSVFMTLVVEKQGSRSSAAVVVDRRTGRPIGKLFHLIPEVKPRRPIDFVPPDVSPDGTLLATHNVCALFDKVDNQPIVVLKVQNGEAVKDVPIHPATAWQGWLAPNRLMTVGSGAGFDIWSYPDGANRPGANDGVATKRLRIGGIPIRGRGTDGGTTEFALSADRKRIALPRANRKVYVILDTATGQELGTVPLAGLHKQIAFSPDGTKFAYVVDVPWTEVGRPPPKGLVIANANTGASGPVIQMPDVGSIIFKGEPLGWWGGDLVYYQGNSPGNYYLADPNTGHAGAKLKASAGGEILPGGRDGRIWVKFGSPSDKPFLGGYLCAFDPPAEISAAKDAAFELTPEGVRTAAR